MPFSDSSPSSDQPLIQAILEPLLDDFQFWFREAQTLLASPAAECLDHDQRTTILNEIEQAQQEVATARTLLLATDGKAGVDTTMVGQWHKLVSRCWGVARQVRQHDAG